MNRLSPPSQSASLVEVLERILDKGVVIAGDITISITDIELLTIKVRLVVASVDKAMEIGIDWWKSDAALSSTARKLKEENERLRERLEQVEEALNLPVTKE